MGEVLFGLIMTLTFTLGAGMVIQEEGRAGAREMLVGILGCNLAWGIIDGVLYVLGQVFERGRVRRIGVNLRSVESDAAARQAVADELDELLASVTDEAERDRVYQHIVARVRATPIMPNRVRREDLLGGLAAGWLVFACSFPAVLPFLVIDDPWVALRVSNAILLALLFTVGWRAARHTLAKPWLAGATFMLVGVLLVALAIPLGG
jgi:VIT1/CCC1 family predicted Fe2+/Mn2+ transporter